MNQDTGLGGFDPTLNPLARERAARLDKLNAIIRNLDEQQHQLDFAMLKSFGRLRTGGLAKTAKPITLHKELLRLVDEITRLFFGPCPQSVILVGPPRCGKTTAAQLLFEACAERNCVVFEARALDLLAGQKFVGEIEERIKTLIEELTTRKAVWFAPDLPALATAGIYNFNPTGILENLLPSIEAGELRVLGETTPAGLEKLISLQPRVRSAFVVLEVTPADESTTVSIASEWAAQHAIPPMKSLVAPELIKEAFELSKHYCREKAAPGNLLDLLSLTRGRIEVQRADKPRPIGLREVLQTLAQLTGLPLSILDDQQKLELDELRRFFAKRICGQAEAVETLIDRIALMKAGLTNPSSPQGVFLFAGPTGTGKTEIAKALAEFLFGSSDKILRLDMSEFQTAESVFRIFGSADERLLGGGGALVNSIRKQPFSVLLVDELEKAHPGFHDFFLQVFDSGQLTDYAGNLADFRHCIIIMTSNLGASIEAGGAIGFGEDRPSFSPSSVEKAVHQTFRKEFINRIDRIVIFRPLDRATMREICQLELAKLVERRGLRGRQWKVEWDESTIEFLLEKGFSTEWGARPLKRAIDEHLLTPLAKLIVNHRFPREKQVIQIRMEGGRMTPSFQAR